MALEGLSQTKLVCYDKFLIEKSVRDTFSNLSQSMWIQTLALKPKDVDSNSASASSSRVTLDTLLHFSEHYIFPICKMGTIYLTTKLVVGIKQDLALSGTFIK